MKPLNSLGDTILKINMANGWDVMNEYDWDTTINKIPAKLALIHSEVSEALEAYREHEKDAFVEELADIIIRVLDLSAGMGVDLDTAVQNKLEKNRSRGYRHGGKRV